jgi:hypothetical protein
MLNQDDRAQASRFYWWIVVLVFLLAAGLRGALAVFNREANDNHYEVIELILEGRTGLTMADCHECFHPKLFYYVCAAMIRAGGLANEPSRIVAGQLLNALAGMVTLGFVFVALNRLQLQPKWRLWTFALIALNPRLIAIHGQLSNDSFAILFGTGAIFLTLKLLQSPSLGLAVATQLVLSFALMTKGTTWVVAIAMVIVFLVRALLEESKQLSRLFVVLYLVTALNGWASVELAGYDFEHYDIYANKGRWQPLYIWEKTQVGRPGVQSIVDGYLTFRLADLLRDPQITNGVVIQQAHRTSVWTQLYARANFAQFEQHPRSWLTTNPNVMHVARCSIVLGLLPLLFLLVGLVRSGIGSLLAWRRWGVPQSNDYAGFFCALVCFGYIAFMIKFTADYRDFAAMKLIYMFPGVLPFAFVLADGMQTLTDLGNGNKTVDRLLQVVLLCLVVSHCVGIGALVKHLAEHW